MILSPYFLIGRSFSKRFSLHFGLQYQKFSNTTKTQYFPHLTSNIDNTLHFKFRYIGIPIVANYSIWNRNKHNFKLGLGLLNNVPISSEFQYDGNSHLRIV